jgi:D-sedoheptulose 7-phosphate isomerase
MGKGDIIKDYLEQVRQTLGRLPVNDIEKIVTILNKARAAGKRIYTIGNGGSAATASHFASDLNKGAIRSDAPRFRAIALTDNMPVITAWANDENYEDIFSQQIENHVTQGDVVIAITGSGNSMNIIKALMLADTKGAVTIALTGFDGGAVKKIARVSVIVPNNCMEQVEDVHLILEHIITACCRESV